MERKVCCPNCNRKFKDEHGLKQHIADFHKQGKRPRTPERYPLHFEDVEGEYEPRQFSVGVREAALEAAQARIAELEGALRDIATPKCGPGFEWSEDEVIRWRASQLRLVQATARAALKGKG